MRIPAQGIEDWLFADRADARLLIAPETAATTRDLIEAYNLALVQALLHRATDIRATALGHLRRVVSYAKLLGLMLLFEQSNDGATIMSLSGPLALFHDTIKYGHALARWVPALVATTGWSLSANLLLAGEKLRLDLDAGAPLPRTHAMSRAHDSKLEARLDRDLRACASQWRIERETAVLQICDADGIRRLVFPDFAITSDERRVLVEVVGYWTPEYLARKLALLERTSEPLILCIDEKHMAHVEVPRFTSGRVITFKKRIDVTKLLKAVEGLARASTPSSWRPALSG